MANYDPSEIEPRWQQRWEADRLYHADIEPSMPKYYALTMLPYPSGELHIGHWFAMTPSDARARFKRMQGYNVMFPIGFDAFGLPAENAAIKRNFHPKDWTFANIDRMRGQLRSMGAMFDWRREAISADPGYYKWTQWFFKMLYEHGLAYRKLAAVDYCPKDNTTLAREQVVGENRVCERCGTPVIKKELEQWFFRITKFADELLHYPGIDWQDKVVVLQTNWIGRSEGASVSFPISPPAPPPGSPPISDGGGLGGGGEAIEVFTTRPDTLWGATFMVLAPEHPLVSKLTTDEQRGQVEAYIEQTLRQSDIQREAADKEKSGVFTGGYAVNPVNGERIPVWIADYVLLTYGTGAIMAVPAHDQRDFEFARKYGLEVRPVIQPEGVELDGAAMTEAYSHTGVMVNSGPFDGTPATEAKGMANPAVRAVTEWLEKKGAGRADVNYRLRDWLISRQRYWGAPIPMVHCKTCGWNPVPDEELPILLPDDVEWLPTGESPLKLHPTWKYTTCPVCDEPAERETDTLDTFMCSSWYHLRYLSPGYDKGPFRQEDYDYWMPVDSYTGGAEHATMHLIYTRFFHKALRDMGLTEGHEPMLQYRSQGHILGPDGNRMSKSKGNVIDPDEQVRRYGADTVRAYLMFGYRWSEGGPWNTENIQGPVRWLRRVWDLFHSPPPNAGTDRGGDGGDQTAAAAADLRRKVHQSLSQVTLSYETYQFNTIISGLMELLNAMVELGEAGAAGTPAWEEAKDIYLRMMAPAVPHIAEELWTNVLGKPYSVHLQPWPEVDEAAARDDVVVLPVQVNGKLRDRIELPAGFTPEQAEAAALASEVVQRFVDGKKPRKVIVVPGKLVNIVV